MKVQSMAVKLALAKACSVFHQAGTPPQYLMAVFDHVQSFLTSGTKVAWLHAHLPDWSCMMVQV